MFAQRPDLSAETRHDVSIETRWHLMQCLEVLTGDHQHVAALGSLVAGWEYRDGLVGERDDTLIAFSLKVLTEDTPGSHRGFLIPPDTTSVRFPKRMESTNQR